MSYLEIPQTIPQSIFRAYDIRGVVGETLTPDIVYAIGLALGSEALARGQSTMITARDGRLSGALLMHALCEGLLDSGCNVIDIGECPTPLLYFATHTLASQSGAMLTGSHNPPDYNGIKMVIAGETLAEQDIQQLYQRIINRDIQQKTRGTLTEYDDILTDYTHYITQQITLARPLKIVIDCGNGVAGYVAPDLFRELGCEVIELFCDVDGRFPNHHPDPSEIRNLQDLIQAVTEYKADIGLAFDGDADRLGVVTNRGEIIWPDRQLILFAQDVLKRIPGATIIYDVKCTRYLKTIIEQQGGKPLMWKTGHSLVKGKMKATGAALAGEMSGHIFFKERWFGFDDGIYTAVRLLEILAAQTQTISEIFKSIPDSVNTPELKLPLSDDRKFAFIAALQEQARFPGADITTIDGLRVDFKDGWGLVRPSNTTPYLILRFEADSEASLLKIQRLFREQLLALQPDLQLPF